MPFSSHSSSDPPPRWLFVDFNSYFASVEQQMDETLRGKPIVVAPVETDSTCAIAASYEAKAFGIKTGTPIHEAKRLCQDIIVVQAKHEQYVKFHEKVVEEIERHYPVQIVGSIDEMGCLLDDKHAEERVALDLGRRIKAGVIRRMGECMRCSVGIAPNYFLAKVASELTKPDGLEVIRLREMPGRLAHLKLGDLPGIGRSMEPRLRAAGIRNFVDLWRAPAEVLHRVWGGVCGDRFWHQLHGGDLDQLPVDRRTVGHSHVLAPAVRRPQEAAVVARRLLLKAASRLRRLEYRAGQMTLGLRTEQGARVEAGARFPPVSDSYALIHTLDALWLELMEQTGWTPVKKISVTLHRLEPLQVPEQLELFPAPGQISAAEREKREVLSRVMDRVNQHYGRDSLALGFAPDQVKSFSGTKVAFTRIPEMHEFQE